jgi:thermitase
MTLKNWRYLASPRFAWSMAVLGSAGAGLFLGLGNPAHSDISKFSALLSQHERFPGEVLVKLSPAGKASLLAAGQIFDSERFRIASIEAFETNNSFYLVKLSGDAQTAEFLEAASKNPAVAYAEPNYVMRIVGARNLDIPERTPNDAEFSKLWGLKNVGQKDSGGINGKAGADIGATKAWTTTTGNRDIRVAIIDTGVDYTHPDLKDNIWANPGESGGGKETNGLDDDGNGFVDDHRGWNFAGVSTNDPMDDNEHGTHVAGTIAGNGDDGVGIAGVNWVGSIVPVKFLTGGGSGSLADAVKAIQYVNIIGAHMSNNSWGGGGFTQSMFDAIKEGSDKGNLFIAAAGNDSQNADNIPHFPAGYQLPNVIAVAATTNLDALAGFSTFGKRTVHIAAPGHQIYSSIPGGRYDSFSGTSMAAPHVAGAAALLWGTDTSMDAATVKDRLLRSRDYVGSLSRKVASSGRLNVYNAINGIYPPSPEPAESDWKDSALQGPVESAHPYSDNQSQEWTLEGPANAKFMRVVFSRVDLESGYDTVKVLDSTGAEMDSITGKGENVASLYVAGNKLKLKFKSDSSQTGWGFAVGKLQIVE